MVEINDWKSDFFSKNDFHQTSFVPRDYEGLFESPIKPDKIGKLEYSNLEFEFEMEYSISNIAISQFSDGRSQSCCLNFAFAFYYF